MALVDHRMPGTTGTDVAAAVRVEGLPTRVLLISAHAEAPLVYDALERGAAGFLAKDVGAGELIAAVREVAAGRDVLPPELAAGLLAEIRTRGEAPAPSPREREVLDALASGRSLPQIAADLHVAPSTVKTHTQRLYEKLGVSDRAGAGAAGVRRRLLR